MRYMKNLEKCQEEHKQCTDESDENGKSDTLSLVFDC